jgi:hypothetical protein
MAQRGGSKAANKKTANKKAANNAARKAGYKKEAKSNCRQWSKTSPGQCISYWPKTPARKTVAAKAPAQKTTKPVIPPSTTTEGAPAMR